MKPKDTLLERWESILAQKGDAPAVFNSHGDIEATFRQVDERARDLERKIGQAKPHNIHAIQIGNHRDWPSLFLACLRTKRIVLPVDESLPRQQTAAVESAAAKGGIADWGDQPPALLKLTS